MKKVAIIIFTDGNLPRKVYKATLAQDYPETSIIISIRKPDSKKSKQDNIIEHMNYSRQLAKGSDADYFFFVESSVVLPKNAVTNLMCQLEQPEINPNAFLALERGFGKIEAPKKKHIIGGWYKLLNKHGKIPTLWSPSRWIADNVLISLLYVERSIVRVDKIASGCIMLSREVMEKITWRSGANVKVNEENGTYSSPCMCAMFGIDAQDAGYDLWMDGSVVCKHLSVPDSTIAKCWLRLTKKSPQLSYQC